ncbi:DNA-binding FadR family transcriptional regulator [Melghiribacillus thermohalophilus]|uniref:DNA-binding FadR family transcriptional regulator n=1 Tax=Melghiribacillus thermohalophilus TaxID=1324956 RepID=A0A4V6P022_9BACI|nr:GntR family transcriptional regulator [Melghiribacillus thermohalophilus]TCT24982.1 DNA-binding FadR family transcriptional regulator [Melghiribacillus thermohalophilus]
MGEHPKVKVYQEVLQKIRTYIDEYNLTPGDKLPSERELAEQLNAGRSSVREALRAIELLGLIETRQGEGTFLRSYRPYHAVEILSTFILSDSRTREELFQVKQLLEKEGIRLALDRLTPNDIDELKEMYKTYKNGRELHFQFFLRIFSKAENRLLLKIWQLVEEFSRTVHKVTYTGKVYQELIHALNQKQHQQIQQIMLRLYEQY